MGDLKIQGITPAVGKIKVGDTNVQKIYNGEELAWPTSVGPGEVQICDYIWTTANSTETELTTGGSIPIYTSYVQMANAYNSGSPAACFYSFDANESYRGLFYNIHAKSLIKPPTGFRLPTQQEFKNLTFSASCNPNRPNTNIHGAPLPNNYREDYLTDTQFLGDSGFNAYGYGQGISNGQNFYYNGTFGTWWTSAGTKYSIYASASAAYLKDTSWGTSPNDLVNVRFVKDV